MKKKEKKGFTLVELIAVIAILSMLIALSMPRILEIFKKGKRSNFVVQAQVIYRAAENKYVTNQIPGGAATTTTTFCSDGDETHKLDITEKQSLKYKVEMNSDGEITKFQVQDASFNINLSTSPISSDDITEAVLNDGAIEGSDAEGYFTCS